MMNRCLSFFLIVALFVTTVSAATQTNRFSTPAFLIQFRGGDDEIGTQDNEQQQQQQKQNLSETNEKTNIIDRKESKKRRRSSIFAAFDMNEMAKEEASIMEETDPQELDEEETISQTKLVGGAMVDLDESSVVGDEAFLEKSSVATMSERLIVDSTSSSSSSSSSNNATVEQSSNRNTTSSDLGKLWWVNMQTHQLSDDDDDDDEDLTEEEIVPSSEEEEEEEEEEESESIKDFVDQDQTEEEEEEEEEEDYDHDDDNKSVVDDMKGDVKIKEELKDKSEEESVPVEEELIEEQVATDLTETSEIEEAESVEEVETETQDSLNENFFISSGLWIPIDNLVTLGLARKVPALKVSSKLRSTRKLAARLTGFHGLLSGKPTPEMIEKMQQIAEENKEELKAIERRIEAVDRAREGLPTLTQDQSESRRTGPFARFGRRRQVVRDPTTESLSDQEGEEEEEEEEEQQQQQEEEILENTTNQSFEDELDESLRMERVKEIDRLIIEGQNQLQQLICEKDLLQRRPNPLFNYTTEKIITGKRSDVDGEESDVPVGIEASRAFSFPGDDLVDEYLDMIFSSRRLTKMNHTDLWRDLESNEEDDFDERIGDDLFTPSANAHKLYQDSETRRKKKAKSPRARNGGGGSWILRQYRLGEKIGQAAETAAYKAVCGAVMSFLARALSGLHGINVMRHSDIRLVFEQAPDLPPLVQGAFPGDTKNYAEETLKTVMRKKTRKGKKRSKLRPPAEDSFVQRYAVTEMLLSHVQISAPLLKLFPLAWQRALLGNIITLATAVLSDFCEGLQFQILGHSLSFTFKPITEEDMINHLGLAGGGFNSRRARAEEFEAAVKATAEDLSEELRFLDKWHERALGSGVLRTQIADLIARVVLTLCDEVLHGARMDLWSAHAGGPRMVAGLEYRTKTNKS